uniref:M56 family metallopeptidase n=1 Tax=uncultured Flavonifractor sp. TaxID=1193534 RepID=UPI00261E42BB|nr:M56 family metallopeptidase [uncultured Flavonifractor sp.]
MDNIWAFLEQTLTATVAAVLLLVTKRLFLDKLSPRWQYGVWAILALRVLLPAGLLGRALLPGGQVVLEAAKAWVERGLSSALTDPYGITQVTAPVPLVRLVGPNSVTDLLFLLYAAGVAALLLWFGLAYLALRRRVARGGMPSPAVLCDSPVYYAMVAPEGDRQQAQQQATQPFEEADLYSSPFWELGFTWSRPAWQAEWSVIDLLPDGQGGYQGLLLFQDPQGEETALGQAVWVYPDKGHWFVEAQEQLHPLDVEPGYIFSDSALPVITYVAEEAGLRIEIDCRYSLGTGYGREEMGPLPHTGFTEYYHSIGGRVYDLDTGEAVSLSGISIWPLNSEGKRGGSGTEVYLPKEVGDSGGGTAGPSDTGVGLDCVAALALEFSYNGHAYTCVALPEEVSP